ncbi:MAG: MBL fold metallo-hydrolase [Candidatus Aminicenantes bacterium]|jgi:glyoxylase-like metal-dependent hydrolase (beta-lactamase superfamily II)
MRQKGKLILMLFFSILIVSASSFAQQRETPPVKLDKLSDRLFQILEGRGANGGVYIGDNGVLVIDAKMNEESVKQTLAEIKKVTDKPIKYLVNTHSDGDHVYGNRFFPETVTIVAHENCREEFFHPRRDGKPSEWNNPELAPFIPSVTYHDKMDIYLGSKKVELWYFGIGHTTGDTVVYFPEEKTAFLGDQIFMGRPQLIHSYKGGNSFEYVKTLTKTLETLDAEKFCSGHSDPIDRNAVKHHIEEMKKIQAKVKTLVKQGKNLEEVKQEFEENHARLVESIFNEIKK